MDAIPSNSPTYYCGTWTESSSYFTGLQEQRGVGPVGNHLLSGGGPDGSRCRQFDKGLASGQITASFVDGHAKTMPLRQYFSSKVTSQNQRVLQYLWPNE